MTAVISVCHNVILVHSRDICIYVRELRCVAYTNLQKGDHQIYCFIQFVIVLIIIVHNEMVSATLVLYAVNLSVLVEILILCRSEWIIH